MSRADDVRVWMVTGALGSMALAVLLIPLRSLVSASNLAFAFMAFTIVVAELGGRGPALITALISAMSLNFFLTEPYLTLAITKTEDLVAFFAVAGSGPTAAPLAPLTPVIVLFFFPPEPYLTLAITKTEDLVAFFALAGCGLIAAAFGQRRERLSAAAGGARHERGVVGPVRE